MSKRAKAVAVRAVNTLKARELYSEIIDPSAERNARSDLAETAAEFRRMAKKMLDLSKEADQMARRKPWSNRDLDDAVELNKGLWYLFENELR